MTTPQTKALPASLATNAVDERPWYELINDAPEPPEDAMQQASTILYVMSILWGRYENDRTVLVSEQTNVIYDSAVPGSVVVPDGYVVFDVPARMIESERRSYRIDEWGKPPDFVLEVASESTAARDLSEKREIYARMGVPEYWRLDKHGYYGEPLVGERLVNGEYTRFELHTEANGEIWSRSEVLGVDFYHRLEDGISTFSLWDSVTGERLKTPGEEVAARQAAEAHAQAAEAQVQVAEAQAQAAQTQAQIAEARAQVAEARNQELQAELERLRQQQ